MIKKLGSFHLLELSEYDASVLTAEVEAANYFESVAAGRDGKIARIGYK